MFSLPDNIFSLESGIYICIGTVSASLITGFLLIINNSINNSRNNEFQLKRENLQRIWQEESERKRWYREKIYDCYRTSIYVLTKLIQRHFEYEVNLSMKKVITQDIIDIEKLSLEFYSEFTIVVAGYPYKDSEEFNETLSKITVNLRNEPIVARTMVAEFMENDTRIKGINN